MRGTVVRLMMEKGYVFVRDTDGNDRFVHANEFVPKSSFYDVREGSVLVFDPIGEGERSLRGVNAHIDEKVVPPSNKMHTCGDGSEDPECEACAELLRLPQPSR